MDFDLETLPTKENLNLNGEEIKQIRERLGFSQEDLARRLGVSRVTVWQWETKKAYPSNLAREKLFSILRIFREGKEALEGKILSL